MLLFLYTQTSLSYVKYCVCVQAGVMRWRRLSITFWDDGLLAAVDSQLEEKRRKEGKEDQTYTHAVFAF